MEGKLYGIGAGPGDPELLTLKAVRIIEKCGVIALPQSGGASTAMAVVESYLPGKELLACHFSMENDLAKRQAARQTVAGQIMRYLKQGRDVGFITLGDPATYSTYMYVHQLITAAGFAAEIIPGITSYAAAAAALGTALCEDNETLTLIPAAQNLDIEALLAYPGNKVLMKTGDKLPRLLEQLEVRGYGQKTSVACRVGLSGQRLYHSIAAYRQEPQSGYFTITIVKERTK